MSQIVIEFLILLFVSIPIGAWLGKMFTQPYITPSKNTGWMIEPKKVFIPRDEKLPSTDFSENSNYENHNFYMFTLENKDFNFLWLHREKADITSVKMNVYDKNKNIVRRDVSVRYTDLPFSMTNPLFAGNFLPRDGLSNRQHKTIGAGQSLHLVLACNPVGKNKYYIFTEESDTLKFFPAEIHKIEQSVPFYLKIFVCADKFNGEVKLIVNEANEGVLEVSVTNAVL